MNEHDHIQARVLVVSVILNARVLVVLLYGALIINAIFLGHFSLHFCMLVSKVFDRVGIA